MFSPSPIADNQRVVRGARRRSSCVLSIADYAQCVRAAQTLHGLQHGLCQILLLAGVADSPRRCATVSVSVSDLNS